jgi:hypothetical protein
MKDMFLQNKNMIKLKYNWINMKNIKKLRIKL